MIVEGRDRSGEMKIVTEMEPRPHIIIDEFLDPEKLKEIMDEIVLLKDMATPGKYIVDGVEDLHLDVKKNLNVWMDSIYSRRRQESVVLTEFMKSMWNNKMKQYLLTHKEAVFEMLPETNFDQTLLSAYGNGDYYHWHKDCVNENIFVTVVVFLCKEPKKFTGGDFVIKYGNSEKVIEFKNNRAIIFPSRTIHSVTPVVLEDNAFENWRFTLQYWAKRV